MKSWIIGLSLSLISYAALACEEPSLDFVPDARRSGRDFDRTRAAMAEYLEGMTAYVSCVDAELATGGENAPTAFKALLIRRHNLAAAEMQVVIDWFNKEFPAAMDNGGPSPGGIDERG